MIIVMIEMNKIEEEHVVQVQPLNLKPKREKKISILMQDKNMAFYDPNASLKKAFGGPDKPQKLDLSAEKPSAQKNRKNKKLWQRLKVPKVDLRRGGSQLQSKARKRVQIEQFNNSQQDIQIYNQQFLQRFLLCMKIVSRITLKNCRLYTSTINLIVYVDKEGNPRSLIGTS